GNGPDQYLVMIDQPSYGGLVEQRGAVFDEAGQAFCRLGQFYAHIEFRHVSFDHLTRMRHGRVKDGRTAPLPICPARAEYLEQDLEERVACWIALRMELGDQLFEGQVLVGVCA